MFKKINTDQEISVNHEYTIDTSNMSPYEVARALLEALEPIKHLSHYGYDDYEHIDRIKIWWRTSEVMYGK